MRGMNDSIAHTVTAKVTSNFICINQNNMRLIFDEQSVKNQRTSVSQLTFLNRFELVHLRLHFLFNCLHFCIHFCVCFFVILCAKIFWVSFSGLEFLYSNRSANAEYLHYSSFRQHASHFVTDILKGGFVSGDIFRRIYSSYKIQYASNYFRKRFEYL